MAIKQEEIQAVGEKLLKHGQTSWNISDDLKIEGMASGNFVIQDKSGGKVELKDLSAEQETLIRTELNLKNDEVDFDSNPLIPDDTMAAVKRHQKKDGKKSPYDENILIPD